MDELVQFLAARLNEDEQTARAAGGRDQQAWAADLSGKDPLGQSSWPVAVRYVTDGRLRGAVANLPVTNERSEDRMVHIARHDPARVLRGIEAKRQMVGRINSHAAVMGWDEMHGDLLRLLASVYADHSDYREEWAP